MKSRLLMLAAAPAVIASAAQATTYLTVPQAQALMARGASLAPDSRTLTDTQVAAIEKAGGVHVLSKTLKAWRMSGGGWFILDQVVGKHEFITYAVTLDPRGAVQEVEILDYRETYGDQVRAKAWLAQFVGKRTGDRLKLDADIKNISGATLSSRHITDGVKRLLATYAIVLAPENH